MDEERPTGTGSVPGRWSPRRGVFVLTAVLVLAAPAVTADASAGNHNPAPSLTLMASSSSMVASSPPWCLTEDDSAQQTYVGSLNGSDTASARLCGLATDYFNGFWYDAGGIGLESDVYVAGQLSDLAIIAPDGTAHHAVLIGRDHREARDHLPLLGVLRPVIFALEQHRRRPARRRHLGHRRVRNTEQRHLERQRADDRRPLPAGKLSGE